MMTSNINRILIVSGHVRNLLMVLSGTRRLKATVQEVSVNKD
jgi:hypothetical protein